jgi:D-glycero-D-manno-heptose 1,7-bisphosphate phosphatase
MYPDKTWTLFLDRDGVINQRKTDVYVLKPDDFIWTIDAPLSISKLSKVFGITFIVTNQQGIAKGLMTENDLKQIHEKLLQGIRNAGGRIDHIYHCPALKGSGSLYRKPLPGMALQARRDFPEIDFKKSVMVGDTISDMKFGKNLKMKTILIETDKKIISTNHKLVDYAFPDLKSFADFLIENTTSR